MEEKIKSAKELKIKAVEQEEQIESTEESYSQKWKTKSNLPMTAQQKKSRAKNKRAKKARKINR